MKILLFDVETAPARSWIWSLWSETTSMSMVDRDWYILCWAAKWLGEKEVMSDGLSNYKRYRKNPRDDKAMMQKLWLLLDEADIVIGHNVAKFDRKKANTRFILNGMKPPSPYKVIDTLLAARKEFTFLSNKLDDLAQALGVGEKLSTNMSLWVGCMDGDMSCWKKMIDYCKNDVVILEKVYLKFRSYARIHPNLNVYLDTNKPCCPKCGSDNINYKGHYYTGTGKFKRFVCKDCNSWGKLRANLLTKKNGRQVLATAAV